MTRTQGDIVILYMMIRNPGVAPIEGFTMLGVSTTRFADVQGTIGSFGSGSKHACNLCLRHNIDPVIYCGTLGLSFYTKSLPVDDGAGVDREFRRVCYRIKGKTPDGKSIKRDEETSFTLEFGVRDWDDLAMGLREFVANALDRARREAMLKARIAEGDEDRLGLGWIKDISIDIVEQDQVRAKAGYTTVFVPLTPDVSRFHRELGKRFLHFSEPHHLGKKIMPKAHRNLSDRRVAVIYKHGVLVREVQRTDKASLFDYNLGDELVLDESRVVDDWTVQYHSSIALAEAEPETLAVALSALTSGKDVWESDFNNLQPGWGDSANQRRERWMRAWEAVAGEDGVVCSDNHIMAEMVEKRGKVAKVIKAESWRKSLESAGVKGEWNVLTEDDRKGVTKYEATPSVQAAHDEFWNLLVKLDMTNGKEKPPVGVFHEMMVGETYRLGYYSPKEEKCYVHTDVANGTDDDPMQSVVSDLLMKAVIEEMAHYVTGSGDLSRDIQQFGFDAIVKLFKLLKQKS
jgi:hypothetical protein